MKKIQKKGGFFAASILAAAVYLLFVSGGVFPYVQEDPIKSLVKGLGLAVVVFHFLTVKIRHADFDPLSTFFFFGLAIGVWGLMRTENIGFALEKIDGAIVCSLLIAMLLQHGYRSYGEIDFQSRLLMFSFLILILTLVYKSMFGFFDREVRFFLNGPIVYGWITGFCSLVSFHVWTERRRLVYLLAFAVFFMALVWTESKGAIFAFLIALAIYCVLRFRRNYKLLLVLAIGGVIFYFTLADQLVEFLEDSRLSAMVRIVGGELNQSDEGSVGSRVVLVDKAMQDFSSHTFLGIGLANFSLNEFVYPHNQHLEIFAEMGVFVGLLHVIFVVLSFWRANMLNKSLIVFFGVAASFSGDVSYLRFLYAFCLVGYMPDVGDRGGVRPGVRAHAIV